MAKNGKISDRQERAILCLLNQPSVRLAAQAAQVGERTMHRWLKSDATFMAAYREARAAAVNQALAVLQQASGTAAVVLARLMLQADAPPAVKAAAASRILSFAIQATEMEEIKRRIGELEQHKELPDEPEEEPAIVSVDGIPPRAHGSEAT